MSAAFEKSIEVLKKICTKIDESETHLIQMYDPKAIVYRITSKQMSWFMNVYNQEYKGVVSNIHRLFSISDENHEYGIDNKPRYNVPHYIPNREQYGSYCLVKVYQKTKNYENI